MKRISLKNTWLKMAGTAFTVAVLAMAAMPLAWAQDEAPAATADAPPEVNSDVPAAPPASMTTLERVSATGSLRLGYRTDSQPFAYRDSSGQPAGYSVMLCTRLAELVKTELALPSLVVGWVPVSSESSFDDLTQGRIDLLCGADPVTLTNRKQVSFSIPVFPGGIGAVVRADAPARLKLVLEARPLPEQPTWRGKPAEVLRHKTFSAVAGTSSEAWLTDRIEKLGIIAAQSPVVSYDEGIEQVLRGESDALFGDRAILLDAVKRNLHAADLLLLDRRFTFQPIALALTRGDEDFRLLVDESLSQLFEAAEFGQLFTETFGEPSENMILYFRVNTLAE